jgi:hypothetical protein
MFYLSKQARSQADRKKQPELYAELYHAAETMRSAAKYDNENRLGKLSQPSKPRGRPLGSRSNKTSSVDPNEKSEYRPPRLKTHIPSGRPNLRSSGK